MFNIFGPIYIIQVPVESCKISVILFGPHVAISKESLTSPFSFICSLLLKDLSLFLFVITAAGVVPCGDTKESPRTSSIVQIIFSFWPSEISDGILRNQIIIIGFDSFSNQRLIYLAPF